MIIPVATTIIQSPLLSNISKIIKRLIHSCLMMFLNANVIYGRKFGFRHNHSTTHAISAITILRKSEKLVTQEILLVGYSLIYRRLLILWYYDIPLKKLEHYGIINLLNLAQFIILLTILISFLLTNQWKR